MFVGHYAASLALKSVEKKTSLGLLFLAVQFVDVLFFTFVLLGIEQMKIVENFTASTHFELIFLPYTHSLLATFVWAGVAYAVYALVQSKFHWGGGKKRVAFVLALAVASHWFFDLIVHTPDLPLLGDTSLKVGFGLWNNAIATYLVEAVLLLGGLWLYLRATTAISFVGTYGMVILVGLLLVVNAVNIFGPPSSDTATSAAVVGLVLYFVFASLAHWLDMKRI